MCGSFYVYSTRTGHSTTGEMGKKCSLVSPNHPAKASELMGPKLETIRRRQKCHSQAELGGTTSPYQKCISTVSVPWMKYLNVATKTDGTHIRPY